MSTLELERWGKLERFNGEPEKWLGWKPRFKALLGCTNRATLAMLNQERPAPAVQAPGVSLSIVKEEEGNEGGSSGISGADSDLAARQAAWDDKSGESARMARDYGDQDDDYVAC